MSKNIFTKEENIKTIEKKKVIGGIIVAAGNPSEGNNPKPLFKIGSISIIKRIVLTFQQAGIFPIVVIVGYKAEEIKRELANYEVIFLENSEYESSQKFDSAKIGLNFLKDKCEQVMFTSASIAMPTSATLCKMVKLNAKLIIPSYKRKSGHPILISSELIPTILKYNGDMGMRGAIKNIEVEKQFIDVQDKGILYDTDSIDKLDELLIKHNEHILHPFIKISIEKESSFFDSRAKLLLILIQETNSVRSACKHMALSYSKAWNILNKLEEELGYEVVERKHGGSKYRKSCLTEEGSEFLRKYQQFEENVREYAREEFNKLF